MTRIAFVPMVALGVIAGAQVFTHRSASGNVTLKFRSFLAEQLGKNASRLTLTGGFNATSSSQGLNITGSRAVVHLSGSDKTQQIQSLQAVGQVVVHKTTAAGRTTTINSSQATYTAGSVEDTVALTGPVTLIDANSRNRETLTATGNQGSATLTPQRTSKKGGLRRAILRGNVHVTVVRLASGAASSKLAASGNTMTYEATSEAPTLTLTGNVEVRGLAAGGGSELRGAGKVILQLNSQGEVTSVRGG